MVWKFPTSDDEHQNHSSQGDLILPLPSNSSENSVPLSIVTFPDSALGSDPPPRRRYMGVRVKMPVRELLRKVRLSRGLQAAASQVRAVGGRPSELGLQAAIRDLNTALQSIQRWPKETTLPFGSNNSGFQKGCAPVLVWLLQIACSWKFIHVQSTQCKIQRC